jgi:polyisoprenoid-binding protein YceI
VNACLALPTRLVLPLALGLLGLTAATGPALVAPTLVAPAPRADLKAGKYTIDGVHSTVVFRVIHNNVSPFYGRFNKVAGHFSVDPAKLDDAAIEITIDADSVDTNVEKRNQHLKSADFFSVKEFPTIEFKGDKVKKSKDDTYEVSGKLTLHGVTKDLTLQVQQTGAAESERGTLAGFETTFTIKRSDFGMTNMLEGVSDEVKLMIGIEAGLE